MKVIVSVFNNLHTDQRVEKVCKTLYDNGYHPVLIGNNWMGTPDMERPYPFFRIDLQSRKTRFAYIEFQRKLYNELKKYADNKTILLANDLETIVPNYLISKKLGIPLVFDSHEIFTEMPTIQGRWVKKIWKTIEKTFVPKIKRMITASDSYADWFVKEYRIKRPVVVKNLPRKLKFEGTSENFKKIILYQGWLNYSRGVDKAILAMQFIENAELWIAGCGPAEADYHKIADENQLNHKVRFMGKLSPDELRKITPKADVGISIEENNGLSYYYSLPNKISDYIQARVPVVVSDFPEMKKIVSTFGVGEIIENHSPEHLAEKLKIVLGKGKAAYLHQLNVAADELCWENEENKILIIFSDAGKEIF
ncbi:glycosyltransferase [Epilithonimonas mollis]|uniref:Glycosyltransferase involved in cell wall bisynthesis n=1 Tax=Epilithonimonas mollis TaxID=216903 RepID=A0A1M6Q0Y1_9FLAO|nr:glycosyltransferase [Epilithonimonas mollis]SHK13842.1 Glycosyltransferase involved in cell wall bisynthesis [Epilithonimonas mollis]